MKRYVKLYILGKILPQGMILCRCVYTGRSRQVLCSSGRLAQCGTIGAQCTGVSPKQYTLRKNVF